MVLIQHSRGAILAKILKIHHIFNTSGDYLPQGNLEKVGKGKKKLFLVEHSRGAIHIYLMQCN